MENTYKLTHLEYIEQYRKYQNDLEILENKFSTSYKGGFKKQYGYIKKIRTEPKINRNSLCPCDSGLKYKKCCINK